MSSSDESTVSSTVDTRITTIFPSAVNLEKFADRVVYRVDRDDVSSLGEAFTQLEQGIEFLASLFSPFPMRIVSVVCILLPCLFYWTLFDVVFAVKNDLDVTDYSFSQATLEQVLVKCPLISLHHFLHFFLQYGCHRIAGIP